MDFYERDERDGAVYYMLYPGGNQIKFAKEENDTEYEYIEGEGWVESGILLDYMWPDAELFGEYREMSLEEAQAVFFEKHIPM